jgi:transposase-like protein
MYRLRTVEGLTLREVAERHGVSQSRARQIIIAYVRETTGRPAEHAQLSMAAAKARGDLRAERRAEADRRAAAPSSA